MNKKQMTQKSNNEAHQLRWHKLKSN